MPANTLAHEQSMQVLKDEIMLHINQIRLQGGGGMEGGVGKGTVDVRKSMKSLMTYYVNVHLRASFEHLTSKCSSMREIVT